MKKSLCLISTITLTAALNFLPASLSSIQLEKAALSITLVEYAKKLLDKEDQS
jgi:hypothetical protein